MKSTGQEAMIWRQSQRRIMVWLLQTSLSNGIIVNNWKGKHRAYFYNLRGNEGKAEWIKSGTSHNITQNKINQKQVLFLSRHIRKRITVIIGRKLETKTLQHILEFTQNWAKYKVRHLTSDKHLRKNIFLSFTKFSKCASSSFDLKS